MTSAKITTASGLIPTDPGMKLCRIGCRAIIPITGNPTMADKAKMTMGGFRRDGMELMTSCNHVSKLWKSARLD